MGKIQVSTTEKAAKSYESTINIFEAMFRELKEIGKKKPDMVVNKFKVDQINRLLKDIKPFLSKEPEGKYLDFLDEEILPQVSDTILVMSQYEGALKAFRERYYGSNIFGDYGWAIKK